MPTLMRRKVPRTLSPIPLPFPSVFSGISPQHMSWETWEKGKENRSSGQFLFMPEHGDPVHAWHWSFRLPDEAVECICARWVWVYGGLHLAAFLRPLLSP